MSCTVAVDELGVGMYIHLEGGWLSHPFPLSSFRISAPEQIATLRGLGLARVRWVPEKSDPPPRFWPVLARTTATMAPRLARATAPKWHWTRQRTKAKRARQHSDAGN